MPPKNKFKLSNSVLDEFCQDIYSYLRRGHTLSECFAAMAARSTGTSEEQLYLSLRNGVREGSLHQAMKKTGVFPSYMVYLIKNAEENDTLEQTAVCLSTYFERERAATDTLHGRSLYPAIMAALTCGILIVTAGFVLPIFADQFASLGISFSPFARWAMRIGRWLCGFAGILLAVTIFAGISLLMMLKNNKIFEKSLFSQKLMVSRFVAALALFSKCGISDSHALRFSVSLCPHIDIEKAAPNINENIKNGCSLPVALAKSGLISGNLLGLLNSNGRPQFILDEAASKLAAESAGRMNRLLVMLEPIIVLILSGASGILLLSVLLPLLGGLASMA